ncbi:hypothetical protein Poly30_43160 [Planctomycetes bacterium Poly30]|uniref:Uncharacterized protein n=1 Tax=Saltatorellus ferox TaxID=2528018 RepID=A0A518EXG6_9BACT|nr:hypothetical protein Poly30_43160 [Planctomycetes bacterium Poly30]
MGRLVAGADAPIGGVRVVGHLYGHGTRVATDENGDFSIDSVTLALPQVGLVLESRAAGARLHFVDRSREPVSGLEVHIEPMDPRAAVVHWLERTRFGPYDLWARSPDASKFAPMGLWVVGQARRGNRMLVGQAEVQVGAGVPSFEIVLDEVPTLLITWDVLDPSGKAVRAFQLRVHDASTGVALPFLTHRG